MKEFVFDVMFVGLQASFLKKVTVAIMARLK